MPMIATCTRGIELTSLPLPSFVTRHDRTGLRDAEVGARDPDVGGEERLAQLPPRRLRQRLELGRHAARRSTAREQLRHLLRRLLDRRRDDVHRVLAGELEDVLAEVGLDGPDAGGLERARSARSPRWPSTSTSRRASRRAAGRRRPRTRSPPSAVRAKKTFPPRASSAAVNRATCASRSSITSMRIRCARVAQRLDVRERRPGLDAVLPQPVRRRCRAPPAMCASASLPRAISRKRDAGCASSGTDALGKRRREVDDARRATPACSARPRRCIRQPGSAVTSTPASTAPPSLSSAIATETSGWRTENVPPKPQQRSGRGERDELGPGRLEQSPRRLGDPQLAEHVARVVVGDPAPLVPARRPEAGAVEERGQLPDVVRLDARRAPAGSGAPSSRTSPTGTTIGASRENAFTNVRATLRAAAR